MCRASGKFLIGANSKLDCYVKLFFASACYVIFFGLLWSCQPAGMLICKVQTDLFRPNRCSNHLSSKFDLIKRLVAVSVCVVCGFCNLIAWFGQNNQYQCVVMSQRRISKICVATFESLKCWVRPSQTNRSLRHDAWMQLHFFSTTSLLSAEWFMKIAFCTFPLASIMFYPLDDVKSNLFVLHAQLDMRQDILFLIFPAWFPPATPNYELCVVFGKTLWLHGLCACVSA